MDALKTRIAALLENRYIQVGLVAVVAVVVAVAAFLVHLSQNQEPLRVDTPAVSQGPTPLTEDELIAKAAGFYRAYNTYSWDTPIKAWEKEMGRLTALPAGEQVTFPLQGLTYAECLNTKCSNQPTATPKVTATDDGGYIVDGQGAGLYLRLDPYGYVTRYSILAVGDGG